MSDEAIQLTNNDAASFKSYAVHKGYWRDPYINYFSPISSCIQQAKNSHPVEHKPPEMSRGYFARVTSMREVIDKFLEKHSHNGKSACQIINLGAGYDTLYFNLFDEKKLPFKYVEVDFMRVVSSKIRLIKSKKALAERISLEPKANDITITDVSNEEPPGLFKLPSSTSASCLSLVKPGNDLITPLYSLVSVDLRNMTEFDKKLDDCKIDRSLPTLFIAECVLVYMSVENSDTLLSHLTRTFERCCFVNFEMVNLSDKFGEIMLFNMQQRACKLAGSDVCGTIQEQINRFKLNGFKICQCVTLTDFYLNKLERKERERIESLEFLDEKELLVQLLDHYCICIAGNFKETECILFD